MATGLLFSQEPISWSYDFDVAPEIIELPRLDLEIIQEQDSINDLDKSQPWRYGIERPVSLDLQNQGTWTDLPDENGRLWQAAIWSRGAVNLSVNFDSFYLPEGSKLQFFNEDKTDVSKLYGNKENTPNNKIASWFVEGDLIYVEYFEPYSVATNVVLKIGSVIHGYRMGKVHELFDTNRGLNDSGDCNYDVNCPVGEDFDNYKVIIKKAVALLTLGNGYLCSASMVNNTAMDKTPYLLTANHCLQNSDPSLWSIRFNWVSPDPVCGEAVNSLDIQTNFTMSGTELISANEISDFALVKLYNPVPVSWDITFAGWDRSDLLPQFQIGIHHPNGDIMKISRDDDGATKENANGTDVWLIGGVNAGNGNGWEIGTTESGSSGSPLFNENGKIIGQLYAGQASCLGTETNNDYDIYGRFASSWDSGNTPQTRLKDWLDPINSGQTSIESVQNILGLPDNQITGILEIYPNPATTSLTITNSKYPHLVYSFYSATGHKIMSGSLSNTDNNLNIANCADGIYFLNLVDEDSNQQITKKIVINK
ncbi:hypothetical protein ULMS_24470 [Patiriisocius marinistellae]|uniref:Secretion system C-terminal sorting domain-containing protein n=1 Tax=Patiriisocius marinistellae TaxID=2494560 RepID=A0A5J4G2D4_9FLAO|nr:T9SS type A sorting domain-containing protein [Patiriisocius marinistellae]GEQ86939.1 hypothetical protein ULMS_24470 [Patiriisocius marinistellae]